MHYFKFHISDYKSHTEHLDLMEDLAFRRLLDWLYLHEKPLPKSVDEISRLIRMRTHCESVKNVLHEFFIETEDGYINERCEQELFDFDQKSKTNKKAAQARWKKEKQKKRIAIKDLDNHANALQTDSERNANHKPRTTNHKPLTIEDSEQSESKLSAIKIADYLAAKIKNNNPKTRPNPKGWIDDIEKTIRIDQRTEDDLISIIDWMYSGDKFWASVILSGKKLRDKFDTMTMQEQANGTRSKQSVSKQTDNAATRQLDYAEQAYARAIERERNN